MTRFSAALLLSFAVAVGLLVGCDSTGPSMGAEDSATLQMHLTDAPGDVTKANVILESASIVPAEDTSDGDSTDTGISVLTNERFEVDLTQLQGEVDTLMAELDIPAGEYGQIRLITANPDEFDVAYETAQGDTAQANLFVPSGSQTGIKINFASPLTVDSSVDTVDVTLDFDVKESFIPRGQVGQTSEYNFTPTVSALVETVGDNTN